MKSNDLYWKWFRIYRLLGQQEDKLEKEGVKKEDSLGWEILKVAADNAWFDYVYSRPTAYFERKIR